MRTAALSLLLLLVCLPAFGAGHDFTTPVVDAAAYPIIGPVVATNGASFLTLWRLDTFGGGTYIYASLAGPQGQLLSSTSFRVEGLPPTIGLKIVVAGDEYLVVSGNEVFAIAPDGRSATKKFNLPAPGTLAWNGKNFVVVSVSYLPIDNASNVDVYLLEANGSPIRTDHIGTAFTLPETQVTATADDFVVLLTSYSSTYLMRISPDGALKTRTPTLIERFPNIAAVAASGNDVIVIGATRFDKTDELWASTVASDGTLITRSKLPTGGWPNITAVSVTAYRDSYVVVVPVADLYGNKSVGVIGLRIGRDGLPIGIPTPIPAGGVSTASNGSYVYTVGTQGFVTGSRVVGSTLTVDDGALNAFRSDTLSGLPRRQIAPVVASDGVDFFAAWSDQTAETQSITTARLSRTGAALDGPGVDLMRVHGYMGAYAVAHAGAAYIVVWHHYQQLWAQRFSSSGTPIDTAPILVQTDIKTSLQVSVEPLGGDFFIVWSTGSVYGAFLRADGVSSLRQLSPTTPPPQYTSESHSNPDVAWDGRRFVVVWTTTQTPLTGFPPITSRTEIRAVRVDVQGVPIDSTSTVVAVDRQRAHIASSGRNFLVITDGFRDLLVAIGRAEGASLVFDTPSRPFRYPFEVDSDVVWDGTSYVAAWRSLFLSAGKSTLASARVTESGVASSMVGLETGSPDSPAPPALATNSLGETLAVISEVREPGSARVRGYFTNELAPLPETPAAPHNLTATRSQNLTFVNWEADSKKATGFVVEGIFKGYSDYLILASTAADARSATILNAPTLELVRVAAYGLGGESEPSETVPVQAPARRRAISR